MLRPRRFEQEIDPGPVQIQARKGALRRRRHRPALDSRATRSPPTSISLLNVVLPAAERWFVAYA